MGISERSIAHDLILSVSVVRYISVDVLFECPSIDEIVVTGTPFDNILEAAEWRITCMPFLSLPSLIPAWWNVFRTTA